MGRGRNGAGRNGRRAGFVSAAQAVLLPPSLPSDVEWNGSPANFGFTQRYTITVAGVQAELSIGSAFRDVRGVNFTVNDTFSRQAVDPYVGQQIILKGMRAWRHHVALVPEGMRWATNATDKDGFAPQRRALFERMGFSPADANGRQQAVKRNGKVMPYEV
jgi:hypothetical protein